MGRFSSIRLRKGGLLADWWLWPSSFIGSWIWLSVLVVSVPCLQAQSGNYTVEVCPDAQWKDAIFLKEPSSPDFFGNVTKWKQEQAKTYVTGTVLTQVRPNIAFVALALVSLLVFLLWRLFRRCCMCCCMRKSCQERRNNADPKKILRGWGYWIQKGILLLFAVAALAILLAGIIMAPKVLFGKVWKPINHLSDYLDETTVHMEDLVNSLDDVNSILDDLNSLVVNDIRLSYIRSKLDAIGTTLDTSAADPNTVVNALTNLDNSMTSMRSQVATLRPQLGSSSGVPASLTTLQAGLPGLSTVVAACSNYSTRLSALNTEFTNLNGAAGPVYTTTSLVAAMTAVEVDSWSTALSSMLASLDIWRSFQTDNTLGNLATSLTTLSSTVDSTKSAQIPAAADALQSFYTAWSDVNSVVKALLDHINYVQTNVARLDNDTNAVLEKLNTVYSSIASLTAMQPSPPGLAANLTAMVSDLSLGPAAALISDLNDAQTAINAVPVATLDDARTALNNIKSKLDLLSPKFETTRSAITTYDSSQTQANFDAMKSSAVSSGNTWDISKDAKDYSDLAAANTNVLAVQTAAGGTLGTTSTSIKTGAASVDSAVAATDAAIASRPPLGPYKAYTTTVKSTYDSMPTPKSKELTAISTVLVTVEDLLVSIPSTVRSQTRSVQDSFGDGVKQLRKKVVDKVADVETDNDKKVKDIDLARYRATCALLGIAALTVVVLLVVVIINCPWGIGCSIFFLLLLAALLFLLACVFAVVLVVAHDGCYHMENVVLTALGSSSTVKPLANYYFFGSNDTRVQDVLKSADLVDIDRMEQKVVDKADTMISDFTRQYSPQPKLSIIITEIRNFTNSTIEQIDGLLIDASAAKVRPLYEDLKSYPCCEVTDYSYKLWVVLTFGAWLMYVTAMMAMGFLGRLDQLPQSGCCGCKPLIGKRLEAKVHPEGEGGDDAIRAIVVAPGEQTMPNPEDVQKPNMEYSPPDAEAYPPVPPQADTPESKPYPYYPPPPGPEADPPPPPEAAVYPPPPAQDEVNK